MKPRGTSLVAWLAASLVLHACGSEQDRTSPALGAGAQQEVAMDPVRQSRLEGAILAKDELEAESLAQMMGQESAPVLRRLEDNADPAIRRLVIQVAVKAPVPDNCRILIRRTADGDFDVRDLAVALLPLASHPSLRPDVLAHFSPCEDPVVKGALARQLGIVGTRDDLPLLRREIKAAHAKQRTDLERHLSLAATRLGDAELRKALILRLATPGGPSRFQALQDCVYVGDRSLAAYFGPALADHTDVFALSIPEEPAEHARVLDVAIHVMGQLGVVLSFPVEALTRFSRENALEAQRIVAAMTR